MKLSACIEMLYREQEFCDRIAAAKRDGFDAIEFWGRSGKDLAAVRDASLAAGMPVAACTVEAVRTNPARFAEEGMLSPESVKYYADVVEESILDTLELNIPCYIATVGYPKGTLSAGRMTDSIIECLSRAVPVLDKYGKTIVVEPLNVLVNHAGYFLPRSDEAFRILREVASPRVKLLYDAYHQQITEGHLIPNITGNIGLIGHFHIADVPGRNEPGTGEIHYKNVLAAIEKTGYDGYVGCEFKPSEGKTTTESVRHLMEIRP